MEKYGKFNSPEDLLKGYTELEKSFTQKCQQLSALEKQIRSTADSNSNLSSATAEREQACAVDETTSKNSSICGTSGMSDQQPSPQQDTEQSAEATVPSRDGADSLSESRAGSESVLPPRVMTGGGSVSAALPNRPKTLKEASELAKKYFN